MEESFLIGGGTACPPCAGVSRAICAADAVTSIAFYLRNPSNPPLTSHRGNAAPEFDRAQGTLGPQNGERTRLACWFRRLAETNFESSLRSF
ncbi:MAG: hypothetical protein DME45_03405 [Verrucomicrobia bacterium]|nr:MAG: hypothetical protein DME45_03405 [Verrucomicrobiota bacterium]